MYNQWYALDYCGNLADLVASGILVSCWRRPNPHCFGDRRDRGGNQAHHRSRGVAFDCAGSPIAPDQNVQPAPRLSSRLRSRKLNTPEASA